MKKHLLLPMSLAVVMLLGAGCRPSAEQATISQESVPVAAPSALPSAEPSPEPQPAAVSPAPSTTPLPVPATSPTPATPAPEPTPEPKPVVKTFNITAKQWVFEPATIRVNKGDTVVLNVTSVDVDHGLSLSQFGVNIKLKSGETKSATFVADKTGTFTFSCNVFCGSGHGSMKGTLIVE